MYNLLDLFNPKENFLAKNWKTSKSIADAIMSAFDKDETESVISEKFKALSERPRMISTGKKLLDGYICQGYQDLIAQGEKGTKYLEAYDAVFLNKEPLLELPEDPTPLDKVRWFISKYLINNPNDLSDNEFAEWVNGKSDDYKLGAMIAIAGQVEQQDDPANIDLCAAYYYLSTLYSEIIAYVEMGCETLEKKIKDAKQSISEQIDEYFTPGDALIEKIDANSSNKEKAQYVAQKVLPVKEINVSAEEFEAYKDSLTAEDKVEICARVEESIRTDEDPDTLDQKELYLYMLSLFVK